MGQDLNPEPQKPGSRSASCLIAMVSMVVCHVQVLMCFLLVFRYLLSNQQQQQQHKSVTDLMPMIGARFYTQLDAIQIRSDVLENEISKEMENGRLCRLLVKLGTINERPE